VAFNDDLIAQFRKNRGVITDGPFTGRDLLLLTTTGGAPTHPAWYHNLRKHPEVIVEVGPEKFPAKATAFARGPERRRLYDQHAAINPGFKKYEQQTTRAIPAVRLERMPG